MGGRRKGGKRGYPMGIIVGYTGNQQVIFWKVYSQRVKRHSTLRLERKIKHMDAKQEYALHEKIVDALRPVVRSGMKSIILVSPPGKDYSTKFMEHANKHHRWLMDRDHPHSGRFRQLQGRVHDLKSVTYFISTSAFTSMIEEVRNEEANQLVNFLEKRLNDDEGLVLHALNEVEQLIYSRGQKKKHFKKLPLEPEYIMLTNGYLENAPNKDRVHRLLQIARNRNIKTKIIDRDSPAGVRLDALGGLVCFMKMDSAYQKKVGERIV